MTYDNPSNALNPGAPAFSPSSSPSQQVSNQQQYGFQVLQKPYIYEGTSYYTSPPQILLPPPFLQRSSQQPPSQPLPSRPLPPQPSLQSFPSQPLPLQVHGGHNSSSSSSSSSNHRNSNGSGYNSNGHSNGYNNPYQTGSTTPHNKLYAYFTNANPTFPFHTTQTIAPSSNGYHSFHFHNGYNYTNSHYSNDFPSYCPYPVDYSNFGPFSTQISQVEGVKTGLHDNHHTTNEHGGIGRQQQQAKGKKSNKNKRKKHTKGKGGKKSEVNGDELDTDKIYGEGVGGNHANDDETNGGETNRDGTRNGDTPNGCDGSFEEEEA